MKFAIRRPSMTRALTFASLWYAVSAVPAGAQGCLTDAEIDAAVGDQVRSGAFTIDSSMLPDRPLCSGLTLAQTIQRMRAQAFPEEAARDEAVRRGLIARERGPRRARQPARRAPVAPRAHASQPAAPSQKVRSKSGTTPPQ